MTYARSELQVVIWFLRQQQSPNGNASSLLLWRVHETIDKLHRRSPTKIPQSKNICNKSRLQVCLPTLPFESQHSVQTITQLPNDNIAIISLRLTFGGTPCPYEWGVISESICDLANALLKDNDWDPLTLSAPTSPPPRRTTLSDDIPFGIGK